MVYLYGKTYTVRDIESGYTQTDRAACGVWLELDRQTNRLINVSDLNTTPVIRLKELVFEPLSRKIKFYVGQMLPVLTVYGRLSIKKLNRFKCY